MKIDVYCQIDGDDFRPAEAERLTGLTLEYKATPGEPRMNKDGQHGEHASGHAGLPLEEDCTPARAKGPNISKYSGGILTASARPGRRISHSSSLWRSSMASSAIWS